MKYDLDAIKARLPDYLDRIGAQPQPKRDGELVALCPLHEDTEPSLKAKLEGNGAWSWYCHPCAEGGSVIDLEMKRTGAAIGDAVRALGSLLELTPDPAASVRPSVRATLKGTANADKPPERPAEPPPAEPLQGDAAKTCADACAALERDTATRDRIAADLGIPSPILASLSRSLDLGLHGDRLAYLYHDHDEFYGLQLRGRNGEKTRFWFAEGKAYHPWRGWRLLARTTRTVYLCEGQSDALALIAAGLEDPANPDSKSAVVAIPGTSFPDHWPRLFAYRHVILCGDNDAPGQKAVAAVGSKLARLAESVRFLNWAGLPESLRAAKDVRDLYTITTTHV